MGAVLLCFAVFTTFVWLFGTAVAHWFSKAFEEDSNEIIQQSYTNADNSLYPSRQWMGARPGRTARPSHMSGPRLSMGRRNIIPLRSA